MLLGVCVKTLRRWDKNDQIRSDALERLEGIADFPFKKFRDSCPEKKIVPRSRGLLPINVLSMEEFRLTNKINEEI